MRFCNLAAVLAPNAPITIQYNTVTVRYHSLDELRSDYIFYDDILFKRVIEIWYSASLYNSIVIVLE